MPCQYAIHKTYVSFPLRCPVSFVMVERKPRIGKTNLVCYIGESLLDLFCHIPTYTFILQIRNKCYTFALSIEKFLYISILLEIYRYVNIRPMLPILLIQIMRLLRHFYVNF